MAFEDWVFLARDLHYQQKTFCNHTTPIVITGKKNSFHFALSEEKNLFFKGLRIGNPPDKHLDPLSRGGVHGTAGAIYKCAFPKRHVHRQP